MAINQCIISYDISLEDAIKMAREELAVLLPERPVLIHPGKQPEVMKHKNGLGYCVKDCELAGVRYLKYLDVTLHLYYSDYVEQGNEIGCRIATLDQWCWAIEQLHAGNPPPADKLNKSMFNICTCSIGIFSWRAGPIKEYGWNGVYTGEPNECIVW